MVSDDKRFPATPRQRQRGIEERGLPRSPLLTEACLLMGGLLLCSRCGKFALDELCQGMRDALTCGTYVPVDRAFTIEGCSFPRIWIASTAALVGFSILAITAQAIQGGWVWRPAAISPRWSRLASWEAALRFAHSQAWIKTSLSFATLVLVSSLAVLLFWRSRMDLFPISGGAQASILIGGLDLVAHWLSRNTLWIVAAIGVMGLAEYAFRKLQFERSMQLSADQFREALRELEGNGRIRRLHARRSAVARQQVARQQR